MLSGRNKREISDLNWHKSSIENSHATASTIRNLPDAVGSEYCNVRHIQIRERTVQGCHYVQAGGLTGFCPPTHQGSSGGK